MERTKAQRLFLIALFLFTIAGGLSASIISNYFKGVFAVDAVQRGLLEIPRELPGVVCVLVIAALPTLGSLSLSLLGFGLYFVGLFVLGLLSPSYAVMQLFVFTYSMGDHMFMPLRDVIAMDLSEEGKTGTFLGTYRSVMTVASMAASALVFVGFRAGFFYFRPDSIVPTFCLAMVILAAAIVCLCRLRAAMPALDVRKREAGRRGLPVKRCYMPYYFVTAVYGFQKRMRAVFAPWIIIELLSMGADTVALLGIAAHFCGSWFAPAGPAAGICERGSGVPLRRVGSAWRDLRRTKRLCRHGRGVFGLYSHLHDRPFQRRAHHAHALPQRVPGRRHGKPVLRPEHRPHPCGDGLRPVGRRVEAIRAAMGLCAGRSGLRRGFGRGPVAEADRNRSGKIDYIGIKQRSRNGKPSGGAAFLQTHVSFVRRIENGRKCQDTSCRFFSSNRPFCRRGRYPPHETPGPSPPGAGGCNPEAPAARALPAAR